jgi:hypothetical protein
MYRDIPNMKYLEGNDEQASNYFKKHNIEPPSLIYIGHGYTAKHGVTWDEKFYQQYGIDFKIRWEGFKLVRDEIRENELYFKLNPNNEDYALIHSSGSDGINRISYNSIDPKLKKIYVVPNTPILFDYYKLIENAKEIHAVSSCFHLFVDSIKTDSKLYFHNGINVRDPMHPHQTNKPWLLI